MTSGQLAFYTNYNLQKFEGNLDSLVNGHCMFYGCAALDSFCVDMPNLQVGSLMFRTWLGGNGETGLSTFQSNTSSLTNGRKMFNGQCNLTTNDSSFYFPRLIDGY